MSRVLAATLLSTIALAPLARAACTDTLYLSGLRQFTQSFRNVNPGTWDSVVVPLTQIGDARSLSKAPMVDTSTLVFPIQFQSNCGSDSTDEATFLRLRDIGYTSRGDDAWKTVNDTYKKSVRVEAYGPVTLGTVSLRAFWEVDGQKHQIAKSGSAKPAAYHVQFQAFRFKGGNGSYQYIAYPGYTVPLRAMAFDNVSEYVTALKPALDSVGKGLDSVRVSARITETAFDFEPTNWSLTTSVHSRASRKPAFVSYRTTHGYVFVLPQPTPLTVLSAEGKIVRQLPAASAPMWDGRDAQGHKVPRGVYMVRGLGLGVLRIPSP